ARRLNFLRLHGDQSTAAPAVVASCDRAHGCGGRFGSHPIAPLRTEGSSAMRTFVPASVAAAIFVALSNVAPAQAQATRTWVASVPSGGNDANPCSRTAPCKTFAGALAKTLAGGMINCVDADGYSAVSITVSVTIDCTATGGSILASSGNGVTISG